MYLITLGPLYLFLNIRSYRKGSLLINFLYWLPLLTLSLFSYLTLTLSYNPWWICAAYLPLFLTLFAATYLSYSMLEPEKKRGPAVDTGAGLYFGRAIAWMFFLGFLFGSLSSLIQAINFWLFGEYVAVQFSTAQSATTLWLLVGMIIGFFYGLRGTNSYLNKNMGAFLRSVVLIYIHMTLYSLLVLFLIIYPLQRLTPISYIPQLPEFLCYIFLFISIAVSMYFFLSLLPALGFARTTALSLLSVPLIILHIIIVSGYSTTLTLTAASILESEGKLSSAKRLYAKTIPYISHPPLRASLNHRQGVFNVLAQNYEEALSYFNKVVTDYSEDFDVYKKSAMYIESFEKNRAVRESAQKILKVQYTTFEQAASCFPNSLSLILNLYDQEPVSTRDLSYSIKESFDDGTFIWKAESYLEKHGFTLLTTFWQTRETLISLLQAGYPALIYTQGHVYTLYGYDAGMDMFFTYDTAKSNRWDDKPFRAFQQSWMKESFLMSIVIKKGDEQKIRKLAPRAFNDADAFALMQKVQIADYYNYKQSYWRDYDQYEIMEQLGAALLKRRDYSLTGNGFHPFPWEAEQWTAETLPLLTEAWAVEWAPFERFILYLLYHKQAHRAQELISLYHSHLSGESLPVFNRFLLLKLAVELAANNQKEVLSLSHKFIGDIEKGESGSYWGYYYKAKQLMEAGQSNAAFQLLLPTLHNLNFNAGQLSEPGGYILELLSEISCREPDLIDWEKADLLRICWIFYGIEPDCGLTF